MRKQTYEVEIEIGDHPSQYTGSYVMYRRRNHVGGFIQNKVYKKDFQCSVKFNLPDELKEQLTETDAIQKVRFRPFQYDPKDTHL